MMTIDAVKTACVWGLPVILLLGLTTELGLRWKFGLGNPLIYRADSKVGYLLAPNQDVRRFGNRVMINEYSMRGESIVPQPAIDTLRLFLLGDSIANGGWWTAQDETLSARLERSVLHSVMAESETAYHRVEVLNASANSWGPRNELAYIQRYGIFGSSVLILLINTDDLFATAPTPLPVGRDRNYPDRKPPLAIAEVIGCYLMPQKPIPELQQVQAEGGDRVGKNLEAIRQIQLQVLQSECHFLLSMTPLLREVQESGPRDYEVKARDRLLAFTQEHQILYLDFLPLLRETESPAALYRDHIHLNQEGNAFVTTSLVEVLNEKQLL